MAIRNTNEQIDKTTDAARNVADEGARTARAATDEAVRFAERTARAGADAARRGTETARDALNATFNTATEAFRGATDTFTQMLGYNGPQAAELARRSSRAIQAVTEASSVLARGAQELSQEVFGLIQDRVQRNAEAVTRIASVRSVQDFVAVQSDLARDNLKHVIDINKRIAERSLRIADEASRVIQAQVEENADRASRAA
jgi:phasin family protein